MPPVKLDPKILAALGLTLTSEACLQADDDSDTDKTETHASPCLSVIPPDDQETGVGPCLSQDYYETGTYETGTYETGTYETGTYETGIYETGTYETGIYETGIMDSGTMETWQSQQGSKAVQIPSRNADRLRELVREKLLTKGVLPLDIAPTTKNNK